MLKIKFTEAIKIVNPKYICLKIIPFASNRNYNSSDLIKTFSLMYKSIDKRISFDNGVIIHGDMKCCYIINITKQSTDFFFIIPEQYELLVKEKIYNTWHKCTIDTVAFPQINQNVVYQLKYKYEDALSLKTDKKSNHLIDSMLHCLSIIQENDNISIINNFIPCSQYGWIAKCDKTFERFKNNESMIKDKSSSNILFNVLLVIMQFIDDVTENLLNDKKKNDSYNIFKKR